MTLQKVTTEFDDTACTHQLLDFSSHRRKIGGAAAGFAHPQLARASGQSAHDLWTAASRSIHPARSSLDRSRLTHKCAQFDTLPCCLECMTALFSLSFRFAPSREKKRSSTPAPPVYERDKLLSDKTVSRLSTSTSLCSFLARCGAETLTTFLSHLMHSVNQVHIMSCS